MDGTLNDFFNEIDKIAPKKVESKKEDKPEAVWQKCFDNTTGYPYYWNVKSNEVTWEVPKELAKIESTMQISTNVAPLFPSTALSTKPKIYKIQEDANNLLSHNKPSVPLEISDKNVKLDSSESRKVVMLTSYENSDSESEIVERTVKIVEDKPQNNNNEKKPSSKQTSCHTTDDEDEVDLLNKIEGRVKVLKSLESDVPPDIDKLSNSDAAKKDLVKKQKKDVTGFALVSYGESDDEEDDRVCLGSLDKDKVASQEAQGSHSILFPVAKPIDVEQFAEKPKEEHEEVIDTRAFKRKRRIAVDLISKGSKVTKLHDTERLGLGFKKEVEAVGEAKKDTKSEYPGFTSGGLMFSKSEVQKEDNDESKSVNLQRIHDTRKTLNEKLTFLSEGRGAVSPVQVMLIQMETLYDAMQKGSLTASYLNKWLTDMCADLVNLESDAAPSGWLLQWDRINKRYYYRNRQTGKSQWDYPQLDVQGEDDEMDISTTPPPQGDEIESVGLIDIQPPPPPRIRSPTPPPPPSITESKKNKDKLSKSSKAANEPLPPGVDSSEVATQQEEKPPESDALGSALNSFYSDLAALETPAAAPAPVAVPDTKTKELPQQDVVAAEPAVKKIKKQKVKVVQGLAMKKKGVSKLVEKWKNVQKDFN